MRISLHNGSTLHRLAGAAGVSERAHSSAGDFELTPESAVQILQRVRAELAIPVDRGNVLQNISFTTTRLFATPAEAQLWCLDYDGAMPRSGTLIFEALAPDGSATFRKLTNAVVSPPRRRCNGATVLLDYAAQGGAIAATARNAVVTGVATAGINATLIPAGYTAGMQQWSTNGTAVSGAANTRLYYNGTSWRLERSGVYLATKTTTEGTPYGLTSWTITTGSGQPSIAPAFT